MAILKAKKIRGRVRGRVRRAFVSMEIIIYLIIAGILLGGLLLVTYPTIKSTIDSNVYKSEFTLIREGLEQFYSNNYQYPGGSGWGWDSADVYIKAEVKAKGWDYSCSGSTITLTTPALDSKTLFKLNEGFLKTADSVSTSGASLLLGIANRPVRK